MTKYFETVEAFWLFVEGTYIQEKDWRYGQTAFNVLAAYRPDLSERVRGTKLDPFYCPTEAHPTVKAFADFIAEHWGPVS